jgi:Ser-tRNA(Ala) deacylase AlaX
LIQIDKVILHVCEWKANNPFTLGSKVQFYVNEKKRRLYARYHSAGHLLDMALALAGRPDLKPNKGYHFPEGAHVEYLGKIAADARP